MGDLIINPFVVGGDSGPTLWTPANMTTVGWWDVADESTITGPDTYLNSIADKSGNGTTLSYGGGAVRTGLTTLNGLNVADFTGSTGGGFLYSATGAFPTPASGDLGIIAVAVIDPLHDHSGAWPYIWDFLGVYRIGLASGSSTQFDGVLTVGGGTQVAASGGPYPGAHVFGSRSDFNVDGKNQLRFDGTDVSNPEQSYTSKMTSTTFKVFVDKNNSITSKLDGHLAEIVAFEDVTLATYQKVEGYAAWKWGLEGLLPAGHPYKSAAPTV